LSHNTLVPYQVLIFSQFKLILNLLETYLNLKDYLYERLDGNVRGNERQAAIDRFCKPVLKMFALCTLFLSCSYSILALFLPCFSPVSPLYLSCLHLSGLR
jgi:hypothetical protein